MDKKVLVLGSSGMAGHVIALVLANTPGIRVIDVGPRRRVFGSTRLCNLSDQRAVETLVSEVEPQYIVNCIGVLVERSEMYRLEAIWHNAYLPHFLSGLCEGGSRKLIHISTDCVFSGKNGPYAENDNKDGDMIYDRTKALGEVSNGNDLTIRTSIAGPELKVDGNGLFSWFMRQKGHIKGYRRALWSGVMTTQLADFIANVIIERPDICGIIHYATKDGISKYDLLKLFNEKLDRGVVIDPVDEPSVDKRLIDTRGNLGRNAEDYDVQVENMKLWIASKPDLYPHYASNKLGLSE